MDKLSKNKSMLVGICLLVVLLSFALFANYVLHLPNNTFFILSRFLLWATLAIMILYSIKIEKQDFFLYKEKKYTFWKVIGIVSLLLVFLIIGNIGIYHLSTKIGLKTESISTSYFSTLLKNNILIYFCITITAGIVEELLLRGYLQTRLEKLLKSSLGGILCSSLIFAILHIGYGIFLQIIVPFWIGLVFAMFYYKFKNIKILIITHIVWDCFALLKYIM
ncbi:MAG: CPBP family intramembrane metalloprotease [Paludibacter sp.]|jgi:membrane protease YdiL (CAAX protease family)|nr:CPBP family intramembrane metalloprotease [Paludibacter sp.]